MNGELIKQTDVVPEEESSERITQSGPPNAIYGITIGMSGAGAILGEQPHVEIADIIQRAECHPDLVVSTFSRMFLGIGACIGIPMYCPSYDERHYGDKVLIKCGEAYEQAKVQSSKVVEALDSIGVDREFAENNIDLYVIQNLHRR